MSKLRNVPGVGWFAAGVALTVLLVPTTIGAVVALGFTGIEGTSTHKANVTSDGQLLTSTVNPTSLLQAGTSMTSTYDLLPKRIQTGPVVITELHTAITYWVTTPGNGIAYGYYVADSSCSKHYGSWSLTFTPTGWGSTETPLLPGLAVPKGDALCMWATSNNPSDFVVHSDWIGYGTTGLG